MNNHNSFWQYNPLKALDQTIPQPQSQQTHANPSHPQMTKKEVAHKKLNEVKEKLKEECMIF